VNREGELDVFTFKRPREAQEWVAIVPDGGDLPQRHLACVMPGRGPEDRPAVCWLETAAWSDPTAALRSLRRRRGLASHPVVALLDRSQYQLTLIESPEVPRDEWRQAMRWQLQDRLDFAADQAALDLLEIPADPQPGRRAEILAVAAAREAVLPLLESASRAGITVTAVDVLETALRNLSALLETEGRAQALLQVGEHQSSLVITAQGELLLSHQMNLVLADLQQDDPQQRQQAFERASLDLQRTLDSFDRSHSQLPLTRLLITPARGLEAFLAHVRELLYVPVQAFDLGDVLDLSAVPELAADPHRLSAYLPAIGAALRPRLS